MAGRAYTMKEMRGIVDYIKERKAFSETKARKMWMDFASSDLTNRTWQSLKETFLKRILPDIHNPYYKLTQSEIRSFREGREHRPSQNKLEFKSASPEQKTVEDNEEPSTSHGNQNGHNSGEEITCSKVDTSRDSVETVILVNSNTPENAEQEENNTAEPQRTKSLRDYISFTEPLTPMMEILKDFSSDDEPILTIDERRMEDLETILTSDTNDKSEKPAQKQDTFDSHPLNNNDSLTIKRAVKRTLRQKSTNKDKDASVSDSSAADNTRTTRSKKADTVEMAEADENSNKITPNKTQTPTPNSITDSLLPNNQEALLDKEGVEQKDKEPLVKHNLDVPKTKAAQTPKSPKTPRAKKNKRGGSDANASNLSQAEGLSSNNLEALKQIENGTPVTNNNAADKEHVISNENEIIEVAPSQPPTNPCLQSISLYDEQFKTLEVSDNEVETTKKIEVQVHIEKEPVVSKIAAKKSVSKSPSKTKETQDLIINMAEDDLLVLKSDSESENEKKKTRRKVPIMPKRDRKFKQTVLQNLFDGVSKKQRRYRHRAASPSIRSSGSSDWTSDSDDDFVAPPRALHRHSRKYLRPDSSRILALGQDGGLFVACGKKVYPIVKDGRVVKNYLTYKPDSDTEEQEERDSYWQKKYLQEKKKTAELTKLLESKTKLAKEESNKRRERTPQLNSPILPTRQPKVDRSLPVHDLTSSNENIPALGNEVVPKAPEEHQEGKTVKIKFAKANEEVLLEGHWQNLHHILGDVMQLFHHDKPEPAPPEPSAPSAPSAPPAPSAPSAPRGEEPEDEASLKPKDRNIDELEDEILKEIEEKDRSARDEDEEPHVTERKRRGGPPSRQSKEYTSTTANKRQKLEENDRSDSEIIVNENKLRPVEPPRLRTLRKHLEPPENPKPIVRSPRKTQIPKESEIETDNETLYKFPSPPEPQRSSRASKGKRTADFASKSIQVNLRSPESTQGYQDTDDSVNYNLRRKKKSITYVVQGRKYSHNTRKKVYEFDASDESSNSLPGIKKIYKNVTVNTEVYRTESYNLLMPQIHLTRLEESPCPNDLDSVCGNNSLNLSPATQNLSKTESTLSINVHIDNSSNVSLPMSPELSMVENISINRNVLNTVDYPTINETQGLENIDPSEELEKFLMSEIDVEVPLMQQECNVKPKESAMDISEGLIEPNVEAVMDENPTISETLDEKMRELLLESAKKGKGPKKGAKKPKKAPAEKAVKAPKAQNTDKKRCSTPNKKKDVTKSKAPSVDAVLEEQMEHCTSGRKSCPPVISDVIEKLPSKRVKIQKEIIKVKIQRPKKIDPKRERKSTHTDSGINDTINSVFLNNTVDLIHNHSESCVVNECYDYDSVELIEHSESIISVNSTLRSELNNESGCLPPELFSSDARDGSSGFTGLKPASISMPSPSEDFHTPPTTIASFNSLITEDLDEPPKTTPDFDDPLKVRPDWHYFSDEEITVESPTQTTEQNNNCSFDPKKFLFSNSGFNTTPETFGFNKTSGSNLKHLFPVTCTVPNLSTISELSRETENTNTRELNEFDVDSLLDEFVSCSGN